MEPITEKSNYLKLLKSETKDLSFLWEKYIIENTVERFQELDSLTEQQKIEIIRDKPIANIGTFDYKSFDRFCGILRVYDYIQYVVETEHSKWNSFNLNNDRIKYIQRFLFRRDTEYNVMLSGRYRDYEVFIGEKKKLDHELIENEMNLLLKYYYGSQDDLFTKLATFHVIFEDEIHPFGDGNGRTGRAIMNLELAKNGYPIIGLIYPDYHEYDEIFTENESEQRLRSLILEKLEKKIDDEISTLEFIKRRKSSY